MNPRPPFYFLPIILRYYLEWEIVCATLSGTSSWLSWRESSSSTIGSCSWLSSWLSWSRSTHWREWSTRLHTTHSTSNGVRVYTLYIPCTNSIIPTTLILISINIKRNYYFLTTLNIKLSNAICPKQFEAKLFRILFMSFNNIRLSFPLRTCSF